MLWMLVFSLFHAI